VFWLLLKFVVCNDCCVWLWMRWVGDVMTGWVVTLLLLFAIPFDVCCGVNTLLIGYWR
jgi:hypothetical protein